MRTWHQPRQRVIMTHRNYFVLCVSVTLNCLTCLILTLAHETIIISRFYTRQQAAIWPSFLRLSLRRPTEVTLKTGKKILRWFTAAMTRTMTPGKRKAQQERIIFNSTKPKVIVVRQTKSNEFVYVEFESSSSLWNLCLIINIDHESLNALSSPPLSVIHTAVRIHKSHLQPSDVFIKTGRTLMPCLGGKVRP